MPSTITQPVTVRIRGDAIAAVEAWAARDGVTKSEFIAQAVDREVHRREEPAPEATRTLDEMDAAVLSVLENVDNVRRDLEAQDPNAWWGGWRVSEPDCWAHDGWMPLDILHDQLGISGEGAFKRFRSTSKLAREGRIEKDDVGTYFRIAPGSGT
jgi:hypothetical protein